MGWFRKIFEKDLKQIGEMANIPFAIILFVLFLTGVYIGIADTVYLKTKSINIQSEWITIPLSYLQILSIIFQAPVFIYTVHVVKNSKRKRR